MQYLGADKDFFLRQIKPFSDDGLLLLSVDC